MDTNEIAPVSEQSLMTSRRAFIASAGGAGAALFAGSAGAVGGLIAAPLAGAKSLATAGELLFLDNVPMGLISGRSGGLPFVEVRSQGDAPRVAYQPLVLEFGAGMPSSLYQWIADSLQQQAVKRSGFLAFVAYDGTEGGRLSFTNALISEVTFPALDGASRDTFTMSITLVPEFTQLFLAPTTAVKHPLPGHASKHWLSSNFRMTMDSIDLSRLAAVQSRTTALQAGKSVVGQEKAGPATASENLVITVAEDTARQFLEWFNQLWGAKGAPNDPKLLRSASLEFLGPDMKNVIGTVRFNGVRVMKIEPQRIANSAQPIRKFDIELQVGSTTIDPKTFV